MYTLTNDSLEVAILDPVADQERFGVRYCTGGYIFQVNDSNHGPLLSGPTYPASFNWFDGQGIPDAFNLGPLREPGDSGPNALIIGIGQCDLEAKKVLEFCEWQVEQQPASITMRTTQRAGSYAFELERTVTLQQRSVRSYTRINNSGEMFIPMRWFPHPFFPQLETSDELCRLNIPFELPASKAYRVMESGFIGRVGWPWQEGYFQALHHDSKTNLVILQRHPVLGLIGATCSYVPDFFPIWGNQYTFSWEPYLEQTIAVGQELSWSIDYDF